MGINETRWTEGAERNEWLRDDAGVSMDACGGEGGWWEVTGVPGTKNFSHGQTRPCRLAL